MLALVWSAHAEQIPIDLNDFYADSSVTVAADGSSALMTEDADLQIVYLSNDPYNWYPDEPGISVPNGLLGLHFYYDFSVPGCNDEGCNDDYFVASIFDASGNQLSEDLDLESSAFGDHYWDLSEIDPAINLLGLVFTLGANIQDGLLNSTVSISDIYLETAAAQVPEPSTLFLLGTGLFGLIGLGRKRFRK
jgi:hypothetical protein